MNDNKELIQSYILTSSKYNFNVSEKRVLYRIIEYLQYNLEGKRLNNKYDIREDLFGDKVLTMPLSAFKAHEKDTNIEPIKKALRSLRDKGIEYNSDKQWRYFGIIESPVIDLHKHSVSFRLDKIIYSIFLDFTKGYSKYMLETAMKFESVYTMRLYELLCNQLTPIEYNIDTLKSMFKIENKYKLPADFIRYVIENSKKELDKKSEKSFTYVAIKKGRKVNSIMFYPTKTNINISFDNKEKKNLMLKNKVSLKSILNPNLVDTLKNDYDFSDNELLNNVDMLEKAFKYLDILLFLSNIKRNALAAKDTKAYVIGSIRNIVEKLDKAL